jgi:quercetin dioxygenase-like cupin family protein
MPESPVLVNEDQCPWDTDPPAPGRAAGVRWRTLISADRTPTRGLSMGVCEVPPDAELSPHHHVPPEVYYVTSGEAEVYLDGEWRPLRRGDVAYIPGDAAHGIRNRGAQPCVFVWVFPADSFDTIEYRDA